MDFIPRKSIRNYHHMSNAISLRNPSCYRSPWNLDYCVIAVNSPLTGWISIPRRTAGWFRTAAALGCHCCCLAKDIMHHHPHRRGNVPVVIHAITPPPPLLARPSSPEWNGWSTFINITGLCGFHQHQERPLLAVIVTDKKLRQPSSESLSRDPGGSPGRDDDATVQLGPG